MARVSKPLVLSEEDLKALEHMNEYGDDEMSLRAKIVLVSTEDRTNKSIAEELHVTEATVRKWKEAFRVKGMQGLESEHAGGRKPSSPAPDDLENTVIRLLSDCPDEKLTAAAIAERLQVDVSRVYYVLRKNGINLSRNRSWEYVSRDNMGDWDPPIICLCLSPSRSLIVASSNPWTDEAKSVQGVFVTHDRMLKETLDKSVIPVSLAGILKTASELPGNASPRDEKPGPFIEKAIRQWDADKETEFYIFSSGDSFTYEGIRAKQCHVCHYESMDEMMSSFLHWMGGRCNGDQHSRVEHLLKELCLFHQKCRDSSQTFVWYLLQKEGTIEQAEGERPSTEGGGDALILPEAKSWSNVEEMLSELLPEMDADEPLTEAGALLFQRGNDGKIQFRLVQSKRKFQAMEEFNFETKEGFERDLSRLEEDTEAFLHEIAGTNYEMFLNGSKKNRT